MPRFFLRVLWKASIEIILLMILLLNLPLATMLTLTEGDTGKELLKFPVQLNDQFSIEYIHSIHRTPVIDSFYINSDLNIVADKTIFDTYGVGIPSELEKGQTLTIANGKFVLNHLNRVLPYFDLRVGQVIANHILEIKDKRIPLGLVTQPGNWIRFEVKKKSLLQIMGGGNLNE